VVRTRGSSPQNSFLHRVFARALVSLLAAATLGVGAQWAGGAHHTSAAQLHPDGNSWGGALQSPYVLLGNSWGGMLESPYILVGNTWDGALRIPASWD
jgi:hypothetical protein